MNWDLFIGRFHPIVVHFPIALLVAAALLAMLSRFASLRAAASAIPFLLWFGTVTAMFAMVLGWFIAGDRGYDETTLFWHRWLGVSVFLIALTLTMISTGVISVGEKVQTSLFVAVLFLVLYTGHLGGALTHGKDYLSEYAPEFIRHLLSSRAEEDVVSLPANPDSLVVFRDLISPILTARCLPCHDDLQRKGGLDVTTQEGLRKGGDNGPAVTPGKSMDSPLFLRVSLPPDDPKFMPVRMTPLSYSEVSLLKWWIDNGADYGARLTDAQKLDIRSLLIRGFNYDPVSRPYYEITSVTPADSAQLRRLRQLGFNIAPLANGTHYLSVSATLSSLTVDVLKELLAIREQTTWLDISAAGVTDDHLEVVAEFENLTRLDIHGNPVTNEGMRHLEKLNHLESLNVYATEVNDDAVETIALLPSIKRVYIWQTHLSSAGVKTLLDLKPTLQIDTGFQFND